MSRIPIDKNLLEIQEMERRLQMSTAEIGLAVRTTNCLEEIGIFTVGELIKSEREDLLNIPNFGEKTLEEVYLSLERLGFYRNNRKPR